MVLLLPSISASAHGERSGGGRRQSAVSSPPSKGLIAAWSPLLATCEAIAEDVATRRLEGIHQKAGLVPKLAQALMLKTGDLRDSQRKRVKSGVTQLTKVAEHLQMVADTGGEEILQGDLKRINRALRLINSQYSEGSLPLGAYSAAGHARDYRD